MDRLSELWEIQRSYSNKIDLGTPEQGTKELCLHVVSELDELLREISWKVHRRDKKIVVKSNILEELVDLQKYIWSIALIWGFTDAELYEEFKRKSEVVEQLWKQEKMLDMLQECTQIAGVDIDGVLSDYPDCFLEFLRARGVQFGDDVGCVSHVVSKGYLTVPEYESWKHEYRQSGYKRNLPVKTGAVEFLQQLHAAGFDIVLLSSRPVKRYKRLFSDTVEWLANNGLQYDALIFDEEKNLRLFREFGDRVKLFVEDEMDKAIDISRLGIPVFLFGDHAEELPSGVVKVQSFDEVMRRVKLAYGS